MPPEDVASHSITCFPVPSQLRCFSLQTLSDHVVRDPKLRAILEVMFRHLPRSDKDQETHGLLGPLHPTLACGQLPQCLFCWAAFQAPFPVCGVGMPQAQALYLPLLTTTWLDMAQKPGLARSPHRALLSPSSLTQRGVVKTSQGSVIPSSPLITCETKLAPGLSP